MSFNIGSIQAFMGLDESGFVSGMLSAESAASVFGGSVVGLVNNPLLGTLAILKEVGTAAAKFMADAAHEAANAADDLADMEAATGATRTQIVGLGLAAQNAGGSLQDVRTILFDIAERAEKSASDTGLQQKFVQLGVATHDANGQLRSAYDILSDVAEAMSKMENSAQRAAIAKDLLGNSGQRLIPILLQGRDGLRQSEEEATKFGLTMSDSAAGAAQKAATVMEQFDAAVLGVKRTIGSSFLEGMLGELNETNTGVSDLAAAINDGLAPAARAVGEFVSQFVPSAESLVTWIDRATEGSNALADALGYLLQPLGWIWDFVKWWYEKGGEVIGGLMNLMQFGHWAGASRDQLAAVAGGLSVTDPDLYNRIKSRRNQIGM